MAFLYVSYISIFKNKINYSEINFLKKSNFKVENGMEISRLK